ncbi:hypothetical protein GLW04_17205 [Halobacillus litoralis]|uniref:ParB/Sulfiredoxin domain-containing protein n=1 Tax=Halobacillus litoralis TaxID=45668 RepID=A0A845DW62_9BACI|nr:ParB N-terminal domain-containing protein [Halobacillus litoralis]MYL21646.1 hypothetical protein [Halobacillus litoralis]
MLDIINKLEEKQINISNICLDPNNPRFIGKRFSGNKFKGTIPEARINESTVQASALERMLDDEFEVAAVRNSILENGFIPLDKIVVRPIQDKEGEFVVVEGNRRIAAIKTLLRQVESGEVTINEDERESLENLKVFVLNESEGDNTEIDQWLLQGIRHLSGIKDWGPYQKATLINKMFEIGKNVSEISQSLGMSAIKVYRYYRVYKALEQMKDSEEFGEYSDPSLFTHFEEAIRIREVKDYLGGWSDTENKFLDDEKVEEFYSWIVPKEELKNDKKLPRGKDVGYLKDILNNVDAMDEFRTHDNKDINDILSKYGGDLAENEWSQKVKSAIKEMEKLTLTEVTKLELQDLEEIENFLAKANEWIDLARMVNERKG